MTKSRAALFIAAWLTLACGFAVLAQEPEIASPIDKEVVLDIMPGEDNPRNSEGDFVRLKSGDLLYVYSRYYGKSGFDNATARLSSRVSKDGGATWSHEDELVLENEGKLNVMSVSLLRLNDDSIALFYLVNESGGDCRPYVRFSNDEGQTWSERVQPVAEPSFNVVNNSRVVQLASGRLLMPIALHRCKLNGAAFDPKATLFCMLSDDAGKTWRRSKVVPNANDIMYQEPGVVELADGRILMNNRNESGSQYFSYSDDQGETWTETEPSVLTSPRSPASIKREPNGDNLIAVWNESKKGRNPMTVALLSPDAKTILCKKTLDRSPENENIGFSYPAIYFGEDGAMLVAYCRELAPGGKWAVRIVRFDLNELKK